jgi:Cu/Ag efflux protein CusF
MIRSLKWLLLVLALTVLAGVATTIWAAEPAGTETLQGTIQSVSADDHQFVLRDNNNRDWTFYCARDAKDIDLAKLKTGDQVTVNYSSLANEIRSGRPAQGSDISQGKIKTIRAGENQFVLTDQNGKDWNFQFAQTGKVRLDNKDSKLGDLKEGAHVTIMYTKQGNQLIANEIEAGGTAGQATQVARGQVERVAANDNQFVLKDQNGKDRTFHVARDAKVRINDQDGTLKDLKQGDEVTVMARLQANEVTKK